MKHFVYDRGAPARAGLRTVLLLPATVTLALLAITSDPAAASRRERGDVTAQEESDPKPMPPKGPLTIVVSTDRQRVTVWSADGKVTEAPVSTGRQGYETPHGIFSVIGKEVEHYSNLYDDAPMPYMQRLTWSGVAMHAGKLPGYPASHGCVRLNHGFSQKLFGMTSIGTRVLVVDGDIVPRPISHPRLFTPMPSGPVAAAAPAATAGSPMHLGGPVMEASAGVMEQSAASTPATVSDAVPPVKRTRQTLADERAAALAVAAGNAKAAEARVKELAPAAKTAALAVFEATKAVRVARFNGERLAAEVRKIEGRVKAAQGELQSLSRMRERIDDDVAMTKAAEREDAIEVRLTALSDELAKARAAVDAHNASVDELTSRARNLDIEKAGAAGALRGAMESAAIAKAALESLNREQANRNKPITVLISRKTGKLSIRQGFEELFETAVAIDNPAAPFGTHLFTASAKPGSGEELRWNVLTLQGGRETPVRPRKIRRGREDETAAVLEPTTAARALDRVTIPDEAQERIAELVKPGSALIITDHGPSRETGKGTDFIVLTR